MHTQCVGGVLQIKGGFILDLDTSAISIYTF